MCGKECCNSARICRSSDFCYVLPCFLFLILGDRNESNQGKHQDRIFTNEARYTAFLSSPVL